VSPPETNGRVKLSWAQIAWAIAVLVAIISGWYDLRTQNILNRQLLELRSAADDKEHAALREEDKRIWSAVGEANAAAKKKEK
jgi:hypothetical protein